jgi:diguanylate cyclase (GGDEF)-like protein
MDALLQHMVDLTGHRDHSMLDMSVITAVQELSDASRTRILGLTLAQSHLVLLEHAKIVRGQAAQVHDNPDPAKCGEALRGFSELVASLEHHDSLALRVHGGGHTVWLPVWHKDKANICLEVTRDKPFDAQILQILRGIISVYRNFQNLLDYSERDALTGLYNRKTFDDQLARMLSGDLPKPADTEVVLERRHGTDSHSSHGADGEHGTHGPAGVLQHWLAVIDVDHFKRINDHFGHVYGDEVLILLANLMQSSFRTEDRVFRFGGEEFVVLLRATSLDNIRRIIERFRGNVEAHEFPQVGRITVSVGFVAVNSYESPVVILGHADQALYYAKTHGRNLACYYDELVGQGLLGKIQSNDDVEFF